MCILIHFGIEAALGSIHTAATDVLLPWIMITEEESITSHDLQVFHIPQDARDPRVHEEKLERIEALWKNGADFTRFGHSASQDMVHSCARS